MILKINYLKKEAASVAPQNAGYRRKPQGDVSTLELSFGAWAQKAQGALKDGSEEVGVYFRGRSLCIDFLRVENIIFAIKFHCRKINYKSLF